MPPRYRSLTTGKTGRTVTKAATRFLVDLWDYEPRAFTFIGTRRGDQWRDHPIRGDRLTKIAAILDTHPVDQFDIYFCPNAFAEPHRRSTHAVPSRCAWCDIDDADPDAYDPQPNILWETSPGRFQGLWLWRDPAPGDIAEQVSRNIRAKDGGDKGGWSITKMLRLPGTINHKPLYREPVVTLQVCDLRPQKLPRSILSPERTSAVVEAGNLQIDGLDPREIMRRYRRKTGLQAGTLMTATRMTRPDRSAAVYMIVVGMLQAGAQDAEIAAVLLVNPYFTDKWGADLAKAEDQILRIRARWEAGQ
jgi:hypothetical protein